MMTHKRSPISVEQGSLTSLTPKRHKADISFSSKVSSSFLISFFFSPHQKSRVCLGRENHVHNWSSIKEDLWKLWIFYCWEPLFSVEVCAWSAPSDFFDHFRTRLTCRFWNTIKYEVVQTGPFFCFHKPNTGLKFQFSEILDRALL